MDEQPEQIVTPGESGQPPSNWKFTPQTTSVNTRPTANGNRNEISWSASEYIAHNKSAGWYITLALGSIILAGIVYLLTRDKISTAAVVVAAIFFGIFAARHPRTLNYKLDQDGITVGQKHYSLSQFKSFSSVQEGAFSGIVFLPLKRFMPSLEIYYDPKDEEKIANILLNQLPYEDRKTDPIDNFVRRIRF